MSIDLNVNGQLRHLEVEPEMPLLWALRDHLALTGTKFGCGVSLCGACTVHIDDAAVRSCITPVAAVTGKRITTIEGLATRAGRAVQQAWVDLREGGLVPAVPTRDGPRPRRGRVRVIQLGGRTGGRG